MNALIETKNKILELFDRLSDVLDSINPLNFEETFPKAIEMAKKIDFMRNQLQLRYGLNNLIEFEPKLFLRAKQIEKKYDNVIESYRNKSRLIEKELEELQGRKKITKYIR